MDNNTFNEMLATNGMRGAIIGVLAILSLFLLAETLSLVKDFGRSGVPATDTITVNGDGQATMAPDVARVSFTVQNTAKTVAEAQAATTKQTNAALDFVKKQGIADKDVKTISYNIYPQYSYGAPCPAGASCPAYREPKITGYQVSQSVQVSVRKLELVGDILSGLGQLEVQNVSGPDFALDDPTAGYDAARADAIAKAKAQAQALANQLGVHIGKIVSFSESSGGYPGPVMYGMGMGAGKADVAAAPSVPTGQNTYSATVNITYEIR